MKNPMKKLTLVTVLFSALILSSQLTFAFPGGKPGHDGQPPSVEQRVERMSKHLELDDDQAAAITKVLKNNSEERTALSEEFQALREQSKNLREKEREAIAAILTEEQKEKIEKRMEKKRDHHKHGERDCKD